MYSSLCLGVTGLLESSHFRSWLYAGQVSLDVDQGWADRPALPSALPALSRADSDGGVLIMSAKLSSVAGSLGM